MTCRHDSRAQLPVRRDSTGGTAAWEPAQLDGDPGQLGSIILRSVGGLRPLGRGTLGAARNRADAATERDGKAHRTHKPRDHALTIPATTPMVRSPCRA